MNKKRKSNVNVEHKRHVSRALPSSRQEDGFLEKYVVFRSFQYKINLELTNFIKFAYFS